MRPRTSHRADSDVCMVTFPYQCGRRLCRVERRNTGAGSSATSGFELSVVDGRVRESA